VAGALLIGSVIGAPLAQAVSAGLVRIEGGHTAHLAAVSKSGQVSVNAGLATTAAGQVKSALASPADTVTVVANAPTCSAGGVYTIPAGKALIITGATFQESAVTAGKPHGLGLYAGPAASPCSFVLAAADAPSSEDLVSQNQVFSPGIPVPAGDALGQIEGNDGGVTLVYGYLVPASAVPRGILKNLRAPRELLAMKPRPA
jgi:hypothetical protein